MTLSSGRQGASLFSHTDRGLADETKHTLPSPPYVQSRPVRQLWKVLHRPETSKWPIRVYVCLSVCELVIWHTRRRWASMWYGINLKKDPVGLPHYRRVFGGQKQYSCLRHESNPMYPVCSPSVSLAVLRACAFHSRFWGVFEKLQKTIISFVRSVRPYGTTRLPLDRFSGNLIFEDFSKPFRGN